MSEPDFSFLSLPEFLLAEIDQRIDHLREAVEQRNPSALIEPLSRLSRIRGNFAFDLISSIAWAAETVCGAAAKANRSLNHVEVQSLTQAIDSMDRARRTALLAAAV
ncbi:MAG TPA: hypothetical protein VL284_11855 [Thermoanaerobaculia bacterium]|nr:hypothetical protein [Thermoanaerobaculia bacterium]